MFKNIVIQNQVFRHQNQSCMCSLYLEYLHIYINDHRITEW